MRTEDQARALTTEESPQGFDFVAGCLLAGDQMIEAEHHERVGVVEDAFVDQQLLPRLIDALINRDRLSGNLPDNALESYEREMEELQRAGDALKEHRRGKRCRLEIRPARAFDLRHGREAIV